MRLHSDHRDAGGYRINAYGAGFVTVNETVYAGTIILGEGILATDTRELRPEDLSAATMERLRETDPEIVIVGTGERHAFPPATLFEPLRRDGIGVEVMSTPAACRTYNILSSEGRRVVALLLPIDGRTVN